MRVYLALIVMLALVDCVTLNAQQTELHCEDFLAALHDGLRLGMSEDELRQIAPETCRMNLIAEAYDFVISERRDQEGKAIPYQQDSNGFAIRDDKVTYERMTYYFKDGQLAGVNWSLDERPDGRAFPLGVIGGVQSMLRHGEMKIVADGDTRRPVLRFFGTECSCIVRWHAGLNTESKTRAARVSVSVSKRFNPEIPWEDLSGRADHDAYREFAKHFAE